MQLLKQVNRNGKIINVYNSDSIAETPPFKLIFQCYNELLEKNLAIHNVPFKPSSSVVWLENENKEILGGIVYEYYSEKNEGWICISFTDPKFRGKGVNAAAHTELYEILRAKGAVSVGSTVSINNEARLRSAKKVGLEPLYYRMYKKL